MPWSFTLAEKLVFGNVKKALGLDQARHCATAAAPIARETLEYFLSLDVTIYEIFGMSETSGPHTVNMPEKVRMFSVGPVFPGAYTKLDNPDAKGNGEICAWGRHIFMGYLKAEEATRATIDAEGYLHSGDLGRIDADGFMYITGRIKELLITAGGENVAPVPIEEAIKAEVPAIGNVVVIGDKKKFLTAIITLKTGVDGNSNPNGKLAELGANWFAAQGVEGVSEATTVAEAKALPAVKKLLAEGIARANKLAVSQAQRVQRWVVIDNDFSIATEELTPTMKIKRRVILEKYAKEIDTMYADAPAAPLAAKL
jgi:long-chain-fatty-acid--CoA ligase ACSBG